MRETEYKWFADYLFKMSQRVTLNEATSTEFFLTRGVPQGSILGPLMQWTYNQSLKKTAKQSVCCLVRQGSAIRMTFAFKYVNTVKTYKYLGCLFDSSLPRNQYFDSCYRKACGRVRLLSKMRLYLTTEAAIKVYQAMILPLMTYSCIINMNLTTSQSDRLSSIGRRVSNKLVKLITFRILK